ncbi:MAG: tRNA guanosine(34) transglycosylase Tgt [Acholeplasmatales bacterium]|jgi:queuine tRNA-ribosyltransferase|nr:tRNA guanosine(34) transglycosylase Tgt [Acholeplasmatales bacterium]
MLSFHITYKDKQSQARIGRLQINSQTFETPIFMPVGTKASVKSLDSQEITEVNGGIILANTFHLWNSPGLETLKRLKGVQNFMDYAGPILTDSGGYQVFSLAKNRVIKEEGVYFSNPENGDRLFLSPEISMEIQRTIKSDIVMCLDECPDANSDLEYLIPSINRTIRWARRCKDSLNSPQALFGINQGGLDKDLRLYCLQELMKMDFDGYAIGGLSVGETKAQMYEITKFLSDYLPPEKPRYLMGVGGIDDLIENVYNGIDMFDCVMPTRNARHGMFYTMEGKFNIKHSRYENDDSPLDTTFHHRYSHYKKSYLRHLFKNKELLVFRILTYHNLFFMKSFMEMIRTSIKENKFLEFRENIKRNTNFYH